MMESKNSLSWNKRFKNWSKKIGLERKITIFLIVIGLCSGILTYLGLEGTLSIVSNPKTILWLLTTNLIVLLILITIVVKRVVLLWIEKKQGYVGAKLHARVVFWFSLIAVTPTIIVSLFSTLFLNLGLEQWFHQSVGNAVKNSLAVASTYLNEHQQSIVADALAMANDIKKEGPFIDINKQRLQFLLELQSSLRLLDEASIINSHGEIIALWGLSITMAFNPSIPAGAFEQARQGETTVLSTNLEDRVRVLVVIDKQADLFLYAGRLVDPKVLAHLKRTGDAVRFYEQMEGSRSQIQITFALMFLMIALLILCSAIWIALVFASKLVGPITNLVIAAEQIGNGNLDIRVQERKGQDEIIVLSRTFNKMVDQLQTQKVELITTNHQLDERRRFTELVLSGVSAGVIGLDADAKINLPNRSASNLLGMDIEKYIGQDFITVLPEIKQIFDNANNHFSGISEGEVTIKKQGTSKTLIVRICLEKIGTELAGYVITFDDITELLLAQRKAAWSDIARRIAHEIKNPLTPIQLAAERLKRKYSKIIPKEQQNFDECIDTIVRQVGSIEKMVDEFSTFARLPAPVFKIENMTKLCHQALVLQQHAHTHIIFEEEYYSQTVTYNCDAGQVIQALTNLLQNAVDAIEEKINTIKDQTYKGYIKLLLQKDDKTINISILDNGCGLPIIEHNKLTEPYVTTRVKGTGLGLAIVKKIMEDHQGNVILKDNNDGSIVTLTFPILNDNG
ncbi:MAG: PAS domain-containing sensor histidine kinase [Alphaproteobacteria bacterium]|nr:PAS domain-containing sensor histidine kinase [Alphaproteobacteria bacterium]